MHIFLTFIVLLFCSTHASGTTYWVTNTNNTGTGSLRSAASLTLNTIGDTIRIDPNLLNNTNTTIVLRSPINLGRVVLIGAYNATDTVYISGGGSSRIFNVQDFRIPFSFSSTTYTTVLENLYLKDGYVSGNQNLGRGAAIFFEGFTDVYMPPGRQVPLQELIIKNCVFDNNQSEKGGGAIYATSSGSYTTAHILNKHLQISNTTFKNNQVTVTGEGGAISITHVTGSGNGANNRFIRCDIDRCSFFNNRASSSQFHGGAIRIRNFGGHTVLANSTRTAQSTNITNSSFYNNVGASDLKIYTQYCANSTLIKTSTILGNIAINTSSSASAYVNVANATVMGDLDFADRHSSNVRYYAFQHRCNATSSIIRRANVTGSANLNSSNTINSSGFSGLNLGPLQDNGGGTWTRVPMPGSNAINAGNPSDFSDAQNGPVTDARRDIGAAEYNCGSVSALNVSICSGDTLHWNNQVITMAGNYIDTLINAAGCDSLITLMVTINGSTSSSTIQTACNNYTWRGTTYTNSGTYIDTLQTSSGCDSILILNLIINNAPLTGFSNNSTVAGVATLSWNAVPSAVDYELRYRVIGSGVIPTYVYTTNPSITLNNLQPNTCYEYSARTRCGGNSTSPWSVVQNFCVASDTSSFCTVPNTITTAPNRTTAAIRWIGVTNAVNYEIRYRKIGTTPLSFVSPTGASTTLSNLTPNTCYEFSVRSICGPNNASDWVRGPDFCTNAGFVCPIPSNITSTPATPQTTITWDTQPNIINYELRYRIIGSGVVPTYVYPTSNSISLTNLVPGACYEFTVRTRCDSTTFSAWASIQNFCVPDSSQVVCPRPANITTTPSSTTATINWAGNSQTSSYEIRYREVGTSALSYAYPTSPNTVLTNLTPNTCYEFSVRTICGSPNSSAWIRATDFCTTSPPSCAAPSNINTTPDSTTATINWAGSPNAVNYEIRYRQVGTVSLSFVSPTGTSSVLTGLMPNTCYEFSVRTICGATTSSSWVRAADFCTSLSSHSATAPPSANIINNWYTDGVDLGAPSTTENGSVDNTSPTTSLITPPLPTVRLAPNPVIDHLHIQLEGGAILYQLRLTNISGQVVHNTTIQGSTQLDLSNLHSGVYFLQIRSEQSNTWQTFKLIKT